MLSWVQTDVTARAGAENEQASASPRRSRVSQTGGIADTNKAEDGARLLYTKLPLNYEEKGKGEHDTQHRASCWTRSSDLMGEGKLRGASGVATGRPAILLLHSYVLRNQPIFLNSCKQTKRHFSEGRKAQV